MANRIRNRALRDDVRRAGTSSPGKHTPHLLDEAFAGTATSPGPAR